MVYILKIMSYEFNLHMTAGFSISARKYHWQENHMKVVFQEMRSLVYKRPMQHSASQPPPLTVFVSILIYIYKITVWFQQKQSLELLNETIPVYLILMKGGSFREAYVKNYSVLKINLNNNFA